MAKKANVMQLAQGSWTQLEIPNQWPAPVSPALYLMQLRLPRLKISPLKRKLTVIMDADTGDAVPQFIKIRHAA